MNKRIVLILCMFGTIGLNYANNYAFKDELIVQTPTGYQYYIPSSGSYVVTFTLQNDDEYYG